MSSGRFFNLPLFFTIVEIIDHIQQTHKLLQKLESGGGGVLSDWKHILIFRRICYIVKSDYYLHCVCLSVCMKWLGSHWMDFHEILCLSIFWKYV
jgi:hypothetical protein